MDLGHQGGVVYQAVYADGKHAGEPGYYGGNNGGRTDPQGKWQDTWVIGPGAPAGPVNVDVLALDNRRMTGETSVQFSVADSAGRCAQPS